MKRKIAASIALMACVMAVTPVTANAAVKNSRCYTSGNGKVVVITGGKLPPCNGNNVDTESDSENVDTESNEYAQRVVELVNIEREKAGLSELKTDSKVAAAANVRATEIRKSFSHTRPDGRSFATALTDNGVSYRGSGENIAWGQKTPEEVVRGWMNSPSHRANILNARFTTIGVGNAQNAKGTRYWVQLFTY